MHYAIMAPMKGAFLLSVYCIVNCHMALAQDLSASRLLPQSCGCLQEFDGVTISVRNPSLHRVQGHSSSEESSWSFDLNLQNTSPHKKLDFALPLTVVVTDEFSNHYRCLGATVATKPGSDKLLSLYPGESLDGHYMYQTPVNGVQKVFFSVRDAMGKFQYDFCLSTDVMRETSADAGDVASDNDLRIVYPKARNRFSPGDVVFLRLDFSREAGPPEKIHVVLPDGVMTDLQARGRYELRIPKNAAAGLFPVVVMAQWAGTNEPRIVSRTLMLHIK